MRYTVVECCRKLAQWYAHESHPMGLQRWAGAYGQILLDPATWRSWRLSEQSSRRWMIGVSQVGKGRVLFKSCKRGRCMHLQAEDWSTLSLRCPTNTLARYYKALRVLATDGPHHRRSCMCGIGLELLRCGDVQTNQRQIMPWLIVVLQVILHIEWLVSLFPVEHHQFRPYEYMLYIYNIGITYLCQAG